MSAPDWVASNAYRILGLPANAGPAQVHAAAASLRRAASLGIERILENDPPELAAPRRMEADIRAAVGRLENPAQRLQDRLFWFNRTTSLTGVEQGTTQDAAEAHDKALRSLLVALKAGVDDAGPKLWTHAIRDWHAAVANDDYWDAFQQIELEADFEPAALPSEIDALRGRSTSIAAAPLVSLGRTAQETGNVTLAGSVSACISRLSDTGGWANVALDELVEPNLVPFITHCNDVHKEIEVTLKREPDAAAHNRAPCAAALARFRNEIGPGLELLRAFAPPDSDGLLRARDAAARCLAGIASATTWTDDFVASDQLYREALVLAEGTVAVFKIENDLEGIQDAVRFQITQNKPKREGLSPAGTKAKVYAANRNETALGPLVENCDQIRSELDSRIRRKSGASSENATPCSTALRKFRSDVSPALELLLAVLPENSDGHLRAREAAARCLASIASATTWTDDFVYAEKLYRDALALARGTMATAMIEHALQEISESARLQRLRGKPIQAAPPLFTFNGIGVTLYGHADPDPQTGSYVATLFFVIFMVPIFPVGRYRVIAHPGRRFQFLGKQPFRPSDRWWLGVALGAIALLFVWLIASSQPQNTGTMDYPGNSGADAAAPSASDATAPATPVTSGTTDGATAPAAGPAVAGVPSESGATGLKALIEAGRARMAAIKGQLASLDAEIDPLTNSMAALKSELDGLDAQQQSGQSVDASTYNGKAEQYNNMLQARRNLSSRYNELVEEHNRLLSDDNAMIGRYNSGER